MSNNALLSTTLSLVALQLGSRLFSFGLNQLLLRSTTPLAFGVATIQFDTLRDTVLFLFREGIRGAVVRTRTKSTSSILQRQSRLLPVFFAPLVLPIFYSFSLYTSSKSTNSSYSLTLALYALSTILELLSEPSYLLTLQSWETLTSSRVRIEGLAVVSKALGTLFALRSLDPSRALEAYGWGQLAYSLTLLVGLNYSIRRKSNEEETSWSLVEKDGAYFDEEMEEVGWALTKQSVVKQVLTEGDKLAVSKFGRVEDLGGYAVALNYGSLVARILFQPLEESSRLYFSSLSSSPSLPSLLSISSHLSLILTFYTHLSLILILLCPPYITPILSLLLGPLWSTTASPTLKAYLYSLPFLAFNGLLEAAFQSLAGRKWLKWGSWWMGVCTVGFATTVWITMGRHVYDEGEGWGSKGLILGNCVNMVMRIGFSVNFLYRYFNREIEELSKSSKEDYYSKAGERSGERKRVEEIWTNLNWSSWIPSIYTIVAFVVAGRICRSSEKRWASSMADEVSKGGGLRALGEHFGIGAIVGISCLGVIAATKRKEVNILVEKVKKRRGGGAAKEAEKKTQ